MLLTGLFACTTTSEKTTSIDQPVTIDEPEIEEHEKVVIVSPPSVKKHASVPVVKRLLSKSNKKFKAKEYHAAANLIERGINISPDDPILWQRLAAIRLEEGNYKQAKQLATKSNVLIEGDPDLREINNGIINQAKKMQNSNK